MIVEIQRRSLGSVPLIEIIGDVDHLTSDLLDAEVNGASQEGEHVLIDFSRCCYIDSGGLSVLLYATRNLAPDGWLGLVGASPDVTRLFEIVGVMSSPRFRFFANLADGQAAIDKASA